jgi:ATP-dependent protease ClpP protease subunit
MYKYLLNLTLPLLLLSLTNLPASQAQGQPERRVSQEPNQSLPINEVPSAETELSPDMMTIKLSGEIDHYLVSKLSTVLSVVANLGIINNILLIINSPGGDTNAGITAYEYLKNLPFTIHTHNINEVSSAASFIYCAGDTKTASPHSRFVLHYSRMTVNGEFSQYQIEQLPERMRIDNNFIEEVTESCTNLSNTETVRALEEDSIYSASEAVEIGLAEKIQFPSEMLGQSCFFASITPNKSSTGDYEMIPHPDCVGLPNTD